VHNLHLIDLIYIEAKLTIRLDNFFKIAQT